MYAIARAARDEGLPVGSVRPITVWPFAGAEIRRLCADAEHVISIRDAIHSAHEQVGNVVLPKASLDALCTAARALRQSLSEYHVLPREEASTVKAAGLLEFAVANTSQ